VVIVCLRTVAAPETDYETTHGVERNFGYGGTE